MFIAAITVNKTKQCDKSHATRAHTRHIIIITSIVFYRLTVIINVLIIILLLLLYARLSEWLSKIILKIIKKKSRMTLSNEHVALFETIISSGQNNFF